MNKKLKDILSTKEYKKLVQDISKCLEKGWSKNKTFITLNISKKNLDTILKDENLTPKNTIDIQNSLLNHKTVEDREQELIDKLEKVDNTKRYIGGYTDANSYITIQCLKCNSIYKINVQQIRKRFNKNINGNMICTTCSATEKEKQKEEKQKQIENKKRVREINKTLKSTQIGMTICEECGALFVGRKKYCSDRCNKKAQNRYRELGRRIKIEKNGKIDYTITLKKLVKRDKNVCYICNKECNLNDYTYQDNYFIAGNYYPSIDHVIPISKGGTHTWDNIRLAHRICNTIKGNR